MAAVDHIRLKLERAKVHLHALDDAVRSYYDSHPCAMTIQFDAKNQRDIIRMQVSKRPDLNIGILAGDYIQNLRACLDHLVWQLALQRKHPKLNPRRMNFPISHDADNKCESRLRLDAILDKLPDAVQPIIESLQPYKAGKTEAIRKAHPLCRLDDLCNIDKHRVIPVRGMMMEMDIPVVPGKSHKWLDQGTIEITIPTPHPELPPPRAGVAFGDEWSGVDITADVLGEIYDFVRIDTIPKFASFFPQEPWFKNP